MIGGFVLIIKIRGIGENPVVIGNPDFKGFYGIGQVRINFFITTPKIC